MSKLSPGALALTTRWLGTLTPLAVLAGPSPADIVCSTVAVLFLLHALWRRDFNWLRQDWLIASLALWAYLCVRALLAADVETGLELALPFGRYVIFAAALQSLILRDALWRNRIALVAVVSLGFLAFDGVVQYAIGRDILGHPLHEGRIVAIYHHPWVGTMIASLFIPATLMIVDQRKYWFAAGFGALCLLAILFSGDRMALLLTLFAIGLLGLLFRQTRRAFLIGAPAALVIIGSILYLNPRIYSRQVVSTYEMIRNLPHTHYGVIWTSALKMSADHPLFGVGPRAFRAVCPDPKYGPIAPYSRNEPRCATHPHNFYLEWLVGGGVVGLGLFIVAMALIVRGFVQRLNRGPPDWVYAGLFVTLLGRLWPLASSTSFHHAWSAVPFWLVVGWGLAYRTPEQSVAAASAPETEVPPLAS